MGEFLPSNLLMDILAEIVCDENAIPELCGSVLFLLCGIDSEKLNTTLLDTIVHHTPAGASSKTLIHYGQEMASSNNYNSNHRLFKTNSRILFVIRIQTSSN